MQVYNTGVSQQQFGVWASADQDYCLWAWLIRKGGGPLCVPLPAASCICGRRPSEGTAPVSIFLWVYLYCLTVLCLLSFVAHYLLQTYRAEGRSSGFLALICVQYVC